MNSWYQSNRKKQTLSHRNSHTHRHTNTCINITLTSWAGNIIILYLNRGINVILELLLLENPWG